jgi:hypothetical protein
MPFLLVSHYTPVALGFVGKTMCVFCGDVVSWGNLLSEVLTGGFCPHMIALCIDICQVVQIYLPKFTFQRTWGMKL